MSSRTHSSLAGRTAVITGAAGGLGAALARGLAEAGAHLALCDIDGEGLDGLAATLVPLGVRVMTARLDVTDRDALARFAADVENGQGAASLLFNNAGVAVTGDFDRLPAEDFDWLMAINFGGVVNAARAFLPQLRRAERANIVNISSLFGLIAPAGQTAYSASKFAVRGFSDALRHELAGTAIRVTTVHPGGIATNIAERARTPPDMDPAEIDAARAQARQLLVMDPARAARVILNGVARNRPRILVGRDAKTAALVERLFPDRYWPIMSRRVNPG